jgi:Ca2+-binding RTX toxin-like protein
MLLAALVPTPATAAASFLRRSGATIHYAAASGESNHVRARTVEETLFLDDAGATIAPAAGCIPVFVRRARCDLRGVTRIVLELGDRDDSAAVFGSGPFVLRGDDGADLLRGGAGNDILEGGGGGDDALDGGARGDVLSGGIGVDVVSYANRETAISASPNRIADDGAQGEGDNVLPDVEGVVAGKGNDYLVGTRRDEHFRGGGGRDVMSGGGGADSFAGRDGAVDTIRCGEGTDYVLADPTDEVGRDCEDVLRVPVSDDRLTVRALKYLAGRGSAPGFQPAALLAFALGVALTAWLAHRVARRSGSE